MKGVWHVAAQVAPTYGRSSGREPPERTEVHGAADRWGEDSGRLNGLRHGRRSPLFASFRSALQENPNNVRSVTQNLLRPEDARHPLFAHYIKKV